MNCKHYGDSYDIVKRNLLKWLSCCGKWSVHPMFTDPKPTTNPKCRRFNGQCAASGTCADADETFRRDFVRFLGVDAVTKDTFEGSGKNRGDSLMLAENCTNHLFVDPNTGLPFDKNGLPSHQGRSPAAAFLRAGELVEIAKKRPDKLTLVFDQSFRRKKEEPITDQIKAKLRWLAQKGNDVHGLAYQSHANFLLISEDPKTLSDAKSVLLDSSKLPKDRLISLRD